ncbi:MAG: NAD-dependent epimerase/dehydratase family protein [Bryobacteraceae bacterium]
MANVHRIFVTGGTGYVGSRLIPALHARGHEVVALAREKSKGKLPPGCTPVVGNALDGEAYFRFAEGADTFIQLVGVSHPSPAKAREFIEIDLKVGLEAVRVARQAGIGHFIYMSVAHPAPAMHAYVKVRTECEQVIADSGLNATIVRPWYVLGPGHLWPYLLVPFYKIAELIPQTRDGALRLGLVTIRELIRALVCVVDEPAKGIRLVSVADVRRLGGA